MNLLHNHILQIYVLFLYTYGKKKRIGENGPSLNETHLQIFFSKIEELRIYAKKKRTDIGIMP